MLSVIPQRNYRLTETDLEILEALNALPCITVQQLSRLFYNGSGADRYSRRRLKRLADGGYIQRLQTFFAPRQGSAPHVFTLTGSGRRTLAAFGIPLTQPYVRPSEQQAAVLNQPFLAHTLACVDVLVAALRLTREDSNITLRRLLTERELKRNPSHVLLTSGQKTAVIPDAFLLLQQGEKPPIALSFEVDRGTQHQKPWRAKVAAMAAWAAGPYRQAFGLDNLTIAVVAPTGERLKHLMDWTSRELEHQAALAVSEIFLFTAASPCEMSPATFFLGHIWQPLNKDDRPVSLLDEQGPAP